MEYWHLITWAQYPFPPLALLVETCSKSRKIVCSRNDVFECLMFTRLPVLDVRNSSPGRAYAPERTPPRIVPHAKVKRYRQNVSSSTSGAASIAHRLHRPPATHAHVITSGSKPRTARGHATYSTVASRAMQALFLPGIRGKEPAGEATPLPPR